MSRGIRRSAHTHTQHRHTVRRRKRCDQMHRGIIGIGAVDMCTLECVAVPFRGRGM